MRIIRKMDVKYDDCLCIKCLTRWEVNIQRIIDKVTQWQITE